MMNFEKIDDYLANRLNVDEKQAFEHELAGDPALKDEVTFQQQVIKGVRQARAAELKHTLSQIPVPSSGWSPGQIAATLISIGVVVTGLYFYFQDEQPTHSAEVTTPAVVIQPEKSVEKPVAEPKPEDETSTKQAQARKESVTKNNKTVTPVQKPDIQVVDPSDELQKKTEEPAEEINPTRSNLSVSKMEVSTSSSSKKYTFHYQFNEGKLLLHGPFDKSLYEILEINGESHAVFLFYKENYYLLDETKQTITPLEPIRDGKLLQRLRDYRGR